VDEVMDPLLVIQGEQDQMINTDSANIIYNESESDEKDIKWYANSGHVITIDKEKETVFEDIYQYLESLRSEEHTSELQSRFELVCRLLREKKKKSTGRRKSCFSAWFWLWSTEEC